MLPDGFLKRMRPLLGEDFAPLIEALTEQEPVRAMRRTSKGRSLSPDALLSDFAPTPVPYEADGFYFVGEGIGHTPAHHAGAIYVQDPGAMAAVAAVDIAPDARIVDLCAAPGGKSSQAQRALGEDGFLLANEIHPSRAKTVVSNVERLGMLRTMVTNLDTGTLCSLYDGYFDLAIVDAPCSGEGMFRKNEQALTEWSEEGVARCAERQAVILDHAATMVRPGGRILYSTCTFSPEENELCIDAFLDRHPDYTLVAPHPRVLPYTKPGLDLPYKHIQQVDFCRRFYPHIAPGEGQFFAVLQRTDGANLSTMLYKDASFPCQKTQKACIESFLKEHIDRPASLELRIVGDRPVLCPRGIAVPPRAVFSAGVLVGEVRGERVLPHHQLFSALGHAFRRSVELHDGDERIAAYLRGEEIADVGDDGFCAVRYEGVTIGGGKRSGHRVKNHYPKGLRA
ncbi:MAG: hypothetical protein IJW83_00395 [Clostridia bacterium]|nr:hypothetical protein [Clostridia bacterium]